MRSVTPSQALGALLVVTLPEPPGTTPATLPTPKLLNNLR